jgi:hypothetical protein
MREEFDLLKKGDIIVVLKDIPVDGKIWIYLSKGFYGDIVRLVEIPTSLDGDIEVLYHVRSKVSQYPGVYHIYHTDIVNGYASSLFEAREVKLRKLGI